MRVVSMYGHTIDLDQIISTRLEQDAVVLIFRNADEIQIKWRDAAERTSLLAALELREVEA